jgi:hypothetical protein
MKKELIGILVCIVLIFSIYPMSISATDTSNNFKSEKSKTRIFIFCELDIFTTGRAYLIPGYVRSNNVGINVSGASGFCFVGNKSMAGTIKIKGVKIDNWESMFILFYTGFMENYEVNVPPPKPTPVFRLNGNAVMVMVSYKL